MEYHQSQNTTRDAWLRPLQDSQDSAGLSTILSYDSDATQHVHQRCADKQIALNLDKCHFFQNQATFAGFKLSSSGYQIDQSITSAISNFPTPTNRTDLLSLDWPTSCLLPPTQSLHY